jgi:hypothetical protein
MYLYAHVLIVSMYVCMCFRFCTGGGGVAVNTGSSGMDGLSTPGGSGSINPSGGTSAGASANSGGAGGGGGGGGGGGNGGASLAVLAARGASSVDLLLSPNCLLFDVGLVERQGRYTYGLVFQVLAQQPKQGRAAVNSTSAKKPSTRGELSALAPLHSECPTRIVCLLCCTLSS